MKGELLAVAEGLRLCEFEPYWTLGRGALVCSMPAALVPRGSNPVERPLKTEICNSLPQGVRLLFGQELALEVLP